MNVIKPAAYYVLTLFMVFWLQAAGNFVSGFSGVSANLVLIAVLYFGLSRGPMVGEGLGFFWGLMIDASSLGILGTHALLYASAGFLAGMLRRQLDEDKGWTQVIFSFAISFLYVVFSLIVERMFASAVRTPSWSMLAQPFINALVAPLLFWFLRAWSQLWDLFPEVEV